MLSAVFQRRQQLELMFKSSKLYKIINSEDSKNDKSNGNTSKESEDSEETDKNEEQIGESPKENEKDKEASIASQTPLTKLFFSIKNLKLFSFCFCGFCK